MDRPIVDKFHGGKCKREKEMRMGRK